VASPKTHAIDGFASAVERLPPCMRSESPRGIRRPDVSGSIGTTRR
jgi:hypothetical protein